MEMNPYPLPNSVLVMDNVKFHLMEDIQAMIEDRYVSYQCFILSGSYPVDRGMHVVYLPPYSPDYNPIETAFSCTKAWIRRHNHQVRAAMESQDKTEAVAILTYAVVETCTPAHVLEWFRLCGYY